MISFMFSVLGSVTFWVVFFVVGFIIGSVIIKHIAPLTWETFKTGKRPQSKQFSSLKADALCMVLVCISVYLFWPVALVGYICWLLLKNLLYPVFRKSVVLAGDFVPDIEIKKRDTT